MGKAARTFWRSKVVCSKRKQPNVRKGGAYFSDEFQHLGDGLWQQNGYCVHENKHDHTLDTDATIDGYISVNPMSTDRSNVDVWKKVVKTIR